MEGRSSWGRAGVAAVTGFVLFLMTLAGSSAAGGPPTGPTVDLQSAAGLAPDGKSMTVQVAASCAERWTVLEAVVTVSQAQASGRGSFPLTCIGSVRVFTAVVPAASGTFRLGDAEATAFVTVRRGKTDRAQDADIVSVQPRVTVELADIARLESGGGAVSITVTAACPVGANAQQSYVNVSQGQTIGSGTYVPVCDGSTHVFDVLVRAAQGTYQTGAAGALTFANVEHAGTGFSGVDEQQVEIVT
jgi:hypothetical protein